ncbi:MAG: hypothetical protein QF521_18040, partial [Alphaproteobacteria bacterium]|nr:hypothetical protein [Alphaproteobacteria bacterium]
LVPIRSDTSIPSCTFLRAGNKTRKDDKQQKITMRVHNGFLSDRNGCGKPINSGTATPAGDPIVYEPGRVSSQLSR